MRVVLADDHPMIRSGVRNTLSEQPGIEVVAEVSNGDDALKAVKALRPDLLVLDLGMPGLIAEQVVNLGRETHPELKTLVLTAYDDDLHVLSLTQVPISGYLLKDEAPENLLQAVRVIGQGAVWFSQSVADRIRGLSRATIQEKLPRSAALTAREREVLAFIARGFDNHVIARHLNLAEQTVRNYASTIYQKLGVSSRLEALIWVRGEGTTDV